MNHQRRLSRLKGYDYSKPGAYFVTIRVKGHRTRMGTIRKENINLSPIGNVVDDCWRNITNRYAKVEVDTFIVMPNHLHGILFIHKYRKGEAFESGHGTDERGSPSNASPLRVPRGTKSGSLGAIIQNFKSISTRKINQLRNTPGKGFWQRGFYDRIIRDDEELNQTRKYILNNPLRWELDEYYSE